MFTDKGLNSEVFTGKERRIFEGDADKGFGIKITRTGKTFFMQYESPVTGKRRFINLGNFGDVSLIQARKDCRAARELVERGIDPQEARQQGQEAQLAVKEERERQEAIERATGTLDDLVEAYIAHQRGQGKKSMDAWAALYRTDVSPTLGKIKARDIRTEHVKDVIRLVYHRGAQRVAGSVRELLSAAFNWGLRSANDIRVEVNIDRFRLEMNPVVAIPNPAPKNAVDRNLSAEEVRRLWGDLDSYTGMNAGTATVLKLMLATGQRVQEVVGMRWDEFDRTRMTWTLPPARTKNTTWHVVPLSPFALQLIDGMEPLSGGGTYVFPNRDDPNQPMEWRSVSKAVDRYCERNSFPSFTPRDLRRTWKSRAREAGLSKAVRDRLQNHAQDDVSSKHYDRTDYLPEDRAAMELWTRWLSATLAGEEPRSNVIRLRAA